MTRQIDNGVTSQEAASLYFGKVMHARLKPVGHRFTYRVMSLLIDLDRLDKADNASALFGVNRRALYSFYEKDHGPRDGSSLASYVRGVGRERGCNSIEKIRLLCYPRLLGYTFNPLSVYYCMDQSDRLVLMIYEVRNTFGEIHSYVLPVKPGDERFSGLQQQHDKIFYVSPFMKMEMRYNFRVSVPSEKVKLHILETDAEGPLLAATFNGQRKPLRSRALLHSFFALPLVTFKIMAAIHWEALRLWLKGAKFVPRQIDRRDRLRIQVPHS